MAVKPSYSYNAAGALVATSSVPSDIEAPPAASAAGNAVSRAAAVMAAGNNAKVTFLGDSWLEGTTADTPGTDDAASLICSRLATRYGITVTKSNLAVSGYTAAKAMLNKLSLAITDAADLYVIGLSGHNDIPSDQASPGVGYPKTAMAGVYEHMIRRIRREVPKADIIVLSGGPYPSNLASNNPYLVAQNVLLRRVAAFYGCEYVDGYGAFTALGTWDDYLAGSHPNSPGHALIADAVLAAFPLPPVRRIAPPPVVPDTGLYGPHRFTRLGWVADASTTRGNGADGTTLSAGWSAYPNATATTGETIEDQFIGTEAGLRLDTGTGKGTVRIEVDGAYLYSSLDLSTYPTGQSEIPIVGSHTGKHRILVTVLSGSVVYRGVNNLRAACQAIDVTSGLFTFTGTWGVATTSAAYYGKKHRTSSTLGDSIGFPFIGTGFAPDHFRYPSSHQLAVTVDGTSLGNIDVSYGTGSGGAVDGSGSPLVSGLDFGYHVATVASVGARSTFRFGAMFIFDETAPAHPRRQFGVGLVGEAVKFPVAFKSPPLVKVWPITSDTGDVRPTAITATGFTPSGTASEVCVWEAEGGLVAY